MDNGLTFRDVHVWIDEDAAKQWYEPKQIYDGTGAPKLYSDFAIIVCHGIRQVYKLPLRQCQGFINSLFVCSFRLHSLSELF